MLFNKTHLRNDPVISSVGNSIIAWLKHTLTNIHKPYTYTKISSAVSRKPGTTNHQPLYVFNYDGAEKNYVKKNNLDI